MLLRSGWFPARIKIHVFKCFAHLFFGWFSSKRMAGVVPGHSSFIAESIVAYKKLECLNRYARGGADTAPAFVF